MKQMLQVCCLAVAQQLGPEAGGMRAQVHVQQRRGSLWLQQEKSVQQQADAQQLRSCALQKQAHVLCAQQLLLDYVGAGEAQLSRSAHAHAAAVHG